MLQTNTYFGFSKSYSLHRISFSRKTDDRQPLGSKWKQ